jgi:hypothetical protein
MPEWRYTRDWVDSFDSAQVDDLLRVRGNDGWELVAITSIEAGPKQILTFKRLAAEEPDAGR